MKTWFLKHNSRRYFRLDMPVRVFIAPSSPIKDREIYATGIDYFPPTIKKLIAQQKRDTLYWLERVQDQKVLVTELFMEVIACIEFFGQSSEKMSKGINPRLDPPTWLSLEQRKLGFTKINALKDSSPKTYTYFKHIEAKYLVFLKAMVNSIENSTDQHFEAEQHLPYNFKIDEILEHFQKEQFEKIPLVQSIAALCGFMGTYLEAYRQMNDDNVLRTFPEQWPSVQGNISACGLAMLFTKRFKDFERVDVFFYFPEEKRTLKFDGTVVDIRSINDQYKERIAVNFDFPNGKDQDFLQHKIQQFELDECLSYEF
ncbi:PilZ domain-containing protein [Hydrogenovibrio kuenenii]|uniref:PilZ domain-containing protein n=1 Tax=Hydrogenovibrio kuenenii TaxID=63658 RepID=UPI0004652DBE|nr:PilZ domain-containing protein [Hydrogenovibrio kuenenii]